MVKKSFLVIAAALLCGCSVKLPPGSCDAQGNLSYGAEVLRAGNSREINAMIARKKFSHLEDLRKYLGPKSNGKGMTRQVRYDIWLYNRRVRDTGVVSPDQNSLSILAVESTKKIISGMAYVVTSDSSHTTITGDAALVRDLQDVMQGGVVNRGLREAYKRAMALNKEVSASYQKAIRRGQDTRRYYAPVKAQNGKKNTRAN